MLVMFGGRGNNVGVGMGGGCSTLEEIVDNVDVIVDHDVSTIVNMRSDQGGF
jgi:hypothetical protein